MAAVLRSVVEYCVSNGLVYIPSGSDLEPWPSFREAWIFACIVGLFGVWNLVRR